MKKIDKLLITSFVGPFVVSFGIALFVLIMQFLWLYIDEIAGKGVSIFILAELIGYLSVATFPMALPIAVLIASVMVLGNLAECYELSSMKSAGVSLLRVMRALIFAGAGIAFFSYLCSNYLIPIANLKFKSRLYDIRKQKPALTIEEGVFNEDFRQFVIRISDKERDGETIKDVLIEDQTGQGRLKFNQILADSGQMFTTDDKRFFVMNLFRGTQYQEPSPTGNQTKTQRYPFVRTNFKSWTKVWDLKEFEMNRTDEDRFANQRSMLSMKQLRAVVDSLDGVVNAGKVALSEDMLVNINPQKYLDPKRQGVPNVTGRPDSVMQKTAPSPVATNSPRTEKQAESKREPAKKPEKETKPARPVAKPPRVTTTELASAQANTSSKPDLPEQKLEKPIEQYASFYETIAPEDREKLVKEALNKRQAYKTLLESRKSNIESRRKESVKTGYELYTKYSFALICFIFLFIGAPMGAIIRKGGFGYSILVSIIFFVTFIVLTITCRKFAESFILTPFWAAMMPCILLAPVGSFLTRRAMNDSQMLNTDRIDRVANWIRKRWFSEEKPVVVDAVKN